RQPRRPGMARRGSPTLPPHPGCAHEAQARRPHAPRAAPLLRMQLPGERRGTGTGREDREIPAFRGPPAHARAAQGGTRRVNNSSQDTLRLIDAVGGGEAGRDEVRALEEPLAADPQLLEQYGDSKRIFDVLGRIPELRLP